MGSMCGPIASRSRWSSPGSLVAEAGSLRLKRVKGAGGAEKRKPSHLHGSEHRTQNSRGSISACWNTPSPKAQPRTAGRWDGWDRHVSCLPTTFGQMTARAQGEEGEPREKWFIASVCGDTVPPGPLRALLRFTERII